MVSPHKGPDIRKTFDAMKSTYHQTYDISRIPLGNKIVDHSDVVGAAPTGDAPTTSTNNIFILDLAHCFNEVGKDSYKTRRGIFKFWDLVGLISEVLWYHYGDVIMGTIASQITSLTIVYSTVYSNTDQRKHRSSASLSFVRGIHRGPVNSPHKWPVTRKMGSFNDVIMPYLLPLVPPNKYHRPLDIERTSWLGYSYTRPGGPSRHNLQGHWNTLQHCEIDNMYHGAR